VPNLLLPVPADIRIFSRHELSTSTLPPLLPGAYSGACLLQLLATIIAGAPQTTLSTAAAAVSRSCGNPNAAATGFVAVGWLLVAAILASLGYLLVMQYRVPEEVRNRPRFKSKRAFRNPAFGRDQRTTTLRAGDIGEPQGLQHVQSGDLISAPTDFRHVQHVGSTSQPPWYPPSLSLSPLRAPNPSPGRPEKIAPRRKVALTSERKF